MVWGRGGWGWYVTWFGGQGEAPGAKGTAERPALPQLEQSRAEAGGWGVLAPCTAPGSGGLRAAPPSSRADGEPGPSAAAPLLTSPNWKAETMVTTTPTKQT